MCELFAMSSSTPVAMTYDMREFARHGGQTHGNRDGWGLVYALERDAYTYKEPAAAATSGLERYVAAHSHDTRLMIAHIRMATAGEPALENTHPFRRVRNGTVCHLAHNGGLPGLRDDPHYARFLPETLGETDSEFAFLILLYQLQGLSRKPAARLDAFTRFCSDMSAFGDCNFLYTEGERLFVHAHKRRYEHDGNWGPPRSPGLHLRNLEHGQSGWQTPGMEIGTGGGEAIMIASVPLDGGKWEDLPEGETLLIEGGEVLARGNSQTG